VTLSRLTFLLALYISLDVANPMMPGALVFSPEDSLEAHLARGLRAHDVATASARAPEPFKPIVQTLVTSFPAVSAPRSCCTRVTRSRLPSPAPAASTEDD
jgi:hypothetical protein